MGGGKPGASVATGLLVSFLVYWLVEVLPERRRRRLLKDNLRYIYRDLKRDILGGSRNRQREGRAP
jgi:hypothetical protein